MKDLHTIQALDIALKIGYNTAGYNTAMTIRDFIKKRKHLIWWVKNYDSINVESIVEATLNYGDWNDVQTLIKILGIKKVAKIFREKSKPSKMGRQNYAVKTKHYFTNYFNKYA